MQLRGWWMLLLWAGCGSGSATPKRPALGIPLAPTPSSWTWVDFPESSCDDGTPTGIGINAGASNNLLVFLNGGGACWDYLTCYQIGTASHGPYGQTEFDQDTVTMSPTHTVMDRSDDNNPFKDWSYVFVPYCTGDVHAGNNVMMYSDNMGMNTHTYHHAGHANVLAFLPRIAATWPSPDKLVVSGSSAGGFGSSFNYDTFRQFWPTSTSYLLDDSGPALEDGAIPDGYKTTWYTNWGLGPLLDPLCGDPCKSDLSQAVKIIARKYSRDRMALLSSLQDQTIRNYFLESPSSFQNDLLALAHDILDHTSNYRYFFVDGQTHTMLGGVDKFTSQGTPLQTWLTQLVSDDPAWQSLAP